MEFFFRVLRFVPLRSTSAQDPKDSYTLFTQLLIYYPNYRRCTLNIADVHQNIADLHQIIVDVQQIIADVHQIMPCVHENML